MPPAINGTAGEGLQGRIGQQGREYLEPGRPWPFGYRTAFWFLTATGF